VGEKGSEYGLVVMLVFLGLVNFVVQVVNVVGNEVGQVVIFRAFPTLLDRIQFRRVRGKPLEGEPIGMMLREERRRRPMHRIAIPSQDHPTTIMMMQCSQEPDDVLGLGIFPQKLEVMR
jgi:hypothetical protein